MFYIDIFHGSEKIKDNIKHESWHTNTKRKHNLINLMKELRHCYFSACSFQSDRHYFLYNVIVIDSCDLHVFYVCRHFYICKVEGSKIMNQLS